MKSVHALWVDGVPGDHHDHGKVGVDQRQRAVLQLASQDALTFTFQFDDCRDVSFYNVIVGMWACIRWLRTCASMSAPWFSTPPQDKWRSCTCGKTFKNYYTISLFQLIPYPRPMTSKDFCWYIRLARDDTSINVDAGIKNKQKQTFSSWASTVFMFPGRSWRPPIISDLIQIVGEYISTH